MNNVIGKNDNKKSFNPYEDSTKSASSSVNKAKYSGENYRVPSSAESQSSGDEYREQLKKVTKLPIFTNLTRLESWISIFFVAVFLVVAYIMAMLVLVIAVLQGIILLTTGQKNDALFNFCKSSFYNYGITVLSFILFLNDEKPFPFGKKNQVSSESMTSQNPAGDEKEIQMPSSNETPEEHKDKNS